MKVFNWDSKFDFGKFKGETLKSVDQQSHSYIFWCIQNIDWFCVEKEIFDDLFATKIYKNIIQKHTIIIDPSIRKVIDNYKEQLANLTNLNTMKLSKSNSNNQQNEYRQQYKNNWLEDSAGTDDDETMNDVYWNLD